MSMIFCEECDTNVDTDYNSEHFISKWENPKLEGRCAELLTDEEVETLQ